MPAQTTVWLTPHEAAEYTRTHVITLRRAVKAGRLRAYRINGARKVRFRLADLDAWLCSTPSPG